MNCPHYHLVPKELGANIAFRKKLLERAAADADFAAQLKQMCSEDILFYINAFCWIFEPRDMDRPKQVPFITRPYQDDAILKLCDVMGRDDVLIEKSRDMGASWMCLAVIEWFWHFTPHVSFLLLSRVEDLVDKTEDPKSLFWKIDSIHRHLPGWLMPRINRQKLHILNLDLEGTIDGASTTGEAATGDRRTAIMLDEFAKVPEGQAMLSSTRDATRCRIFNSTPQGRAGAFYDQRTKMLETGGNVIRLHWSLDQEKAKGLYYQGGKPRSPWYDNECRRAAHPMEIASELDIGYEGSDAAFFTPEELEKNKADICAPYLVGEPEIDPELHEVTGFTAVHGGRLKLWISLYKGKPRNDRQYVFGIDVSQGTGASNSCIAIGDAKTGEQIGEWVSPNVRPEQFGRIAVALAKWFAGSNGSGAFMVWEAAGPGRGFGATVVELGYRNMYMRSKENSLSKATSDVPGWFPTPEGKTAMLGDYRRALHERCYINHSEESIKECSQYVWLVSSNTVVHVRSVHNVDPSGAKGNHGDRVIAAALCWKGLKQFEIKTPEKLPPPRGSLAERRELAEAEARKSKADW